MPQISIIQFIVKVLQVNKTQLGESSVNFLIQKFIPHTPID